MLTISHIVQWSKSANHNPDNLHIPHKDSNSKEPTNKRVNHIIWIKFVNSIHDDNTQNKYWYY